jgi:hypothetical protein
VEITFTWEEFLRWLAGPGVAMAVGALASELEQYLPGFAPLAPKWKRVVFFLLSLCVPTLASVLGIVTCNWPLSLSATFWPALVSGLIALGSGTLLHTRKLKDWRVEIQDLTAQIAEARATRVFEDYDEPQSFDLGEAPPERDKEEVAGQ